MIYKEILDPVTQAHLRFDLVDENTDPELVAERQASEARARAVTDRTATARAKMKTIKSKGRANITLADLQDGFTATCDLLGIE